MFRGALFDWDGTVVDSCAAHEESWMQLAREEHLHLTRKMFRLSFGCTNKVIIPNAYKWTRDPAEVERLSLRKEVIYREIIASHSNATDYALPGAIELLRALKKAGIPCAVGSSAPRANIDQLAGLLGIADCFRELVTAENVSHGKPDPEVFLKGAKAIGIDPQDCVVFEDAVHGIEAAKSGSMKGVAVLTSHPKESFVGKADLIVNRLTDVSLADLRSLWK
jgi:HAD superfamily hydrolase (TIGR01509 family)